MSSVDQKVELVVASSSTLENIPAISISFKTPLFWMLRRQHMNSYNTIHEFTVEICHKTQQMALY